MMNIDLAKWGGARIKCAYAGPMAEDAPRHGQLSSIREARSDKALSMAPLGTIRGARER